MGRMSPRILDLLNHACSFRRTSKKRWLRYSGAGLARGLETRNASQNQNTKGKAGWNLSPFEKAIDVWKCAAAYVNHVAPPQSHLSFSGTTLMDQARIVNSAQDCRCVVPRNIEYSCVTNVPGTQATFPPGKVCHDRMEPRQPRRGQVPTGLGYRSYSSVLKSDGPDSEHQNAYASAVGPAGLPALGSANPSLKALR